MEILPKMRRREIYSLIKNSLNENNSKCETFNSKSTVFRSVSTSEAIKIANRLSVPRLSEEELFENVEFKKKRKINDQLTKERVSMANERTNEWQYKSLHKRDNLKSLKDQTMHVKRVNQPTVASNIRLTMFRQNGNIRPSDIANACERSILQPSQRYYPLAYKKWLKVEGIHGLRTDSLLQSKSTNTEPSWLERMHPIKF